MKTSEELFMKLTGNLLIGTKIRNIYEEKGSTHTMEGTITGKVSNSKYYMKITKVCNCSAGYHVAASFDHFPVFPESETIEILDCE